MTRNLVLSAIAALIMFITLSVLICLPGCSTTSGLSSLNTAVTASRMTSEALAAVGVTVFNNTCFSEARKCADDDMQSMKEVDTISCPRWERCVSARDKFGAVMALGLDTLSATLVAISKKDTAKASELLATGQKLLNDARAVLKEFGILEGM